MIDKLCDELEAAWSRDESPRLEDFLAKVPAAARSSAFRDLLCMQLAIRPPPDAAQEAADLMARFPQHAETIAAVLAFETTAPSPSRDSTQHWVPTGEMADKVAKLAAQQAAVRDAGTRIIGDFEIISELGKGGMGVVFAPGSGR